MAEAAVSSASAPTQTPTQGSSQSSQAQAQTSNQLHLKSAGQGKPQSASESTSSQAQPTESKSVEEEFEEIKVGTAKGKVPKELAKAIKEIEKGFHTKAQESATIKRQFQDFAKAAKDNPEVFFKEFGIDPDQFSEARLAKKLQLEMMDPNQRKAMELEEENKKYKAEEQKRLDEEKNHEEQTRYQQEGQKIRGDMMKAWQGSGLPAHPYFGQRMAAVMAAANTQNLNWTWDHAAAKVLEDHVENSKSIYSNLNPQQFEEVVGRDLLNKWREFDVKRVTDSSASLTGSANQRPGQKPAIGASSNRSGKLPSLTESQWRDWRDSGLPIRDWLAKKK